MLRLSLFAFAALLAAPAFAQDTPTETVPDPAPVMADTVMADTTAAEPAFVPSPEKARELYSEGNERLQQSDFEGAIEKYDEALLNNPDYSFPALGRAQALVALGRTTDARAAFDQAIALGNTANQADVVRNARTQLADMMEREEQAVAAQASADQLSNAVTRSAQLLQNDPVTEAQAREALGLLQMAEAGGVDADGLAFYYAKAHLTLGEFAQAVPYAQTAVETSSGQPDRSAYYIQLGLVQRGAGDMDAARSAFESAKDGSWASWADHYLREMDTAAEEG